MRPNKDIEYMSLAIREARRSHHEDDKPHPYVGVVVVNGNGVLATACRGDQAPGDHAEFCALEKKLALTKLAGCTVYTTLEPCTTRNHPKIPCANRLIERRVGRVVIGALDPDQRITGQGILRLRRANIAVDLFPPDLMAELEKLNRDFTRECEARSATQALPADKLVHDLASWLLSEPLEDSLIKGIALREAGHAKRAIECLEEAALIDPRYPRYYSNVAHAYADIGDFNRAIENLHKALDIRRTGEGLEWPRYHFHLARYHIARGRKDDAASATRHLSQAIATGPTWKDTVIRSASVFGSILDDALSAALQLV
jgi:pyrimidine deaminase RibD-like protein